MISLKTMAHYEQMNTNRIDMLGDTFAIMIEWLQYLVLSNFLRLFNHLSKFFIRLNDEALLKDDWLVFN